MEDNTRGLSKPCKVCGKNKTITNTYTYIKDGYACLGSVCKVCNNKRTRKWQASNPDRQKLIQRKVRLKAAFGLTIEQYNEMLAKQNGVCAICLGNSQKGISFYIDHNHTTGKIRGLLCVNCNLAIGHMKDDPHLALEVARYLLTDLL